MKLTSTQSGSGHSSCSTFSGPKEEQHLGTVTNYVEDHFPLTDSGNAERLVARYGVDLRFCRRWNTWLVWNGLVWEPDQTGEVMRRAKDTARHIRDEAAGMDSEEAKPILRHARSSESQRGLNAMVSLTANEPGVSIFPDDLDVNPWLLNVRNGTLDLQTGSLRRAQRDDLITKRLEVEFDKTATCPVWDAFLLRAMDGNESLVRYLQRAVGYALTGITTEQCLFFLHGKGANGKSTFLESVRHVLGPYATNTDFTTFLDQRSERIRNDLARLKGARFVSSAEAGEGRHLDEVVVKQVTGGDPITARFLRQEFFEYRPEFKLFLAANHKPIIRGTDHGIWRRIRLVPFRVTIPKAQQDAELPEKLRREAPGILAWAVRGCLDWRGSGLAEPSAIQDATEEYRFDMDQVGRFLADCCVEECMAWTEFRILYSAYQRWCEVEGEPPLSGRAFGTRLTDLNYDRKRRTNGTWGRVGLRLVSH